MKILVTGGNGMVGNCIKNIQNDYPQHKFIFLTREKCNLENRLSVLMYFADNKDIDCIIHLANCVGGLFMNLNNNIDMFSKNVKINENVLEACKKYNINKGIFCLSSCIFPCNPSKFPMNEEMIHESPPHYSNEGYAYSKRMLEMQCRHYNETHNTEYICVIPVNLYGPYDNFNLQNGHVIASLINRFHKEKQRDNPNYYVYGDGSPYRQFLYAPDFAKIICELLLNNIYNEKTPIICCNDEITIKEMVKTICSVMDINKEKIEWGNKLDNGCEKKTVDNLKFKKYLNNFIFTPLDDGLKETYKWYKENLNNLRE